MVVYQGISHFTRHAFNVICTGLEGKSKNPKTGKMAQLYILPDSEFNTNREEKETVCGDCPLLTTRACYVNTSQAPAVIYNKMKRGGYKSFDLSSLKGVKIRFGAYGEPSLIPIHLFEKIVSVIAGWTGYTHQWANKWAKPYQKYLMASVESLEGKKAANAIGWRTFRIVSDINQIQSDEIMCPASVEYKAKTNGKIVTCASCLLCSGTSARSKKNVAIVGHGGLASLSNIQTYVQGLEIK